MFRLLGLHPGPDIGLPAAASLAGLSAPQARLALTGLTSAHLLTEHAPGRFALHDLLRAYATELASAVDSDGDRHAATHRLLDHYLHTGYAADRLAEPYRKAITLEPIVAGAAPATFATAEQALAWFDTERPVLLAAAAHAARSGFGTHAWQIPWTLSVLLDRRGHWQDKVASYRTALAAAVQAGDQRAQAVMHRGLGSALTRVGHYTDAQAHMEDVVRLCHELDDKAGQATGHLNLGWVFEQQGRYADALDQARRALGLSRQIGDRSEEAVALSSVGWCHSQLGDLQQALACCQQGLALSRELGDRHGEASVLDSLGLVHHRLGDHTSAVACYRQALGLFAQVGDRHHQAATLTQLGDAHQAAADPDAARNCWQQALTLLDSMQHPTAAQLRAKLAGLPAQNT
jgi:tetratricopeptide (TPR) repeat protein